MRLYELTGAYAEIQSRVESGEDCTDLLDQVTDALEQKAAAIGHVLRNSEADSDALAAEIKRLQGKKSAIDNNRERLREYIKRAMSESGILRVKAPTFSITLSDGPETVEVLNEDELPEEFVRRKREPNKTAILDAYKQHGEYPNCVRIVRNKRLVIR